VIRDEKVVSVFVRFRAPLQAVKSFKQEQLSKPIQSQVKVIVIKRFYLEVRSYSQQQFLIMDYEPRLWVLLVLIIIVHFLIIRPRYKKT
jgi:hypothetical protein